MTTADMLLEETAQVRLAGNPLTSPEVLETLRRAASPTVRAALAMNPATTPALDAQLATDSSEAVRVLLARKLALLAPVLPRALSARLEMQTYSTLAHLVADEASKVRQMIVEILGEMPDAPRELIMQLAQDSDFAVAEPVLRLSPLLTPADLLALLDRRDMPATAVAVAKRRGLEDAVAETIARSENAPAIAALLANQSAAIREATLDALVDRSAKRPDWHQPLVRRPSLSSRAARALSAIVTTELLGELAARVDLTAEAREEIQRRLIQRLARPQDARQSQITPPQSGRAGLEPSDSGLTTTGAAGPRRLGVMLPEPTLPEAMVEATRLHELGSLDENALLMAIRRGECATCVAILAVRSSLAPEVIERAASLRFAKVLVSLVWAAGFSMRAAEPLQSLLGQLPPSALLQADAVGNFPLSAAEMTWQIELLNPA